MASGPMVPHSFPGLLEDTWPGMPQWSTLKFCAASYLSQTAISAGSAAEQAAVHKTAKYALLPETHVFVPIAFETLWPVNAEGAEFLSELGRCISSVSGYQRERNFLLQRLSICVQRHNAIVFRGTFQDGREAWGEA